MSNLPHLLIVDDNAAALQSLRQLFMDDYRITAVLSGTLALQAVASEEDLDAVILDIKMSGVDGLETARQIKLCRGDLPIIFYTGHPGDYSEPQIEAVYQPFDFITKNERPARLIRTVKNAVARNRLNKRTAELIALARSEYDMIGSSPAMLDVYRIIETIALSDSEVMILGQTGTGKELVARAIHRRSARAEKKFRFLNCHEKQPELVMAELFGFIRGAFTGAHRDQKGLFEDADLGTLFLDEIGDLDLNTQVKLLRVLESGEMIRVGSQDVVQVNVRLICATHHDLATMVKRKRFREDLYFRLKGVTIQLPPLHERREDIPALIDHIIVNCCCKKGEPIKVFEPAARDLLITHDWPGNVRELKKAVESLINLSISYFITAEEVHSFLGLSDKLPPAPKAADLKTRVQRDRERYILDALDRHGQNISAAARELGIDRSNLHKLVKKLRDQAGKTTSP
jgi:DNA-binding NtrC family response regulator